jgi:hypothetical protein
MTCFPRWRLSFSLHVSFTNRGIRRQLLSHLALFGQGYQREMVESTYIHAMTGLQRSFFRLASQGPVLLQVRFNSLSFWSDLSRVVLLPGA